MSGRETDNETAKKKSRRKKFNYVPRKSQNSSNNFIKVDDKCREATPEAMRIEIDQIFKQFLDDPEAQVHVFPADLTNLQRKYIHAKAQKMNIISKSKGKEPNRQLHLQKKSKNFSDTIFEIAPCSVSQHLLKQFFNTKLSDSPCNASPFRRRNYKDTIIGKLVNGPATVPSATFVPNSVRVGRKSLPIHAYKDLICEVVRNNQVVVISSETGSGKTTQVPQFLMEEARKMNASCKIVCTQPRRISTISAAERVSYERGDTLGASVGYHIKLEQKYGLSTNLIYCTTGVLLRNLMNGNEAFENITHILIDEVHERDKLQDFLLTCLKQILSLFPHLRIILMSATVNEKKFVDYFRQGEIIQVPGRCFQIDAIFLEEILVLTKYMSPRMRSAKTELDQELAAEKQFTAGLYTNNLDVGAGAVLVERNPLLDEALEEYLNFSENYDYKLHYEEATAQLGMYFFSEGFSVNYQHSKNGLSALMVAAFIGDKEFITRLCNMGADMKLGCFLGKTVFDYAEGKPEILRLLNYIKTGGNEVETQKNGDEEYLLKLFDKTTPDDVIDFNLIVTLILFIHHSNQEGAVLVFLPGYDDIMMCNDRILNSAMTKGTFSVYFLHGSMNVRDQHEVFKRTPGRRKIILSTNIAETSITIEDVVFVIDSGRAKEKTYDSYNKVSALQTRWISRACVKQRAGRAGRTKPGICFRLFSKQRYQSMDEERVPEILRVSLEELCLHAKVIASEDVNINDFLCQAPDPPSANSIKVAVENLQFLGALDKEEDLTVLGGYLAQLTVEPRLGKMLIYSVIFKCMEPVLTLAAALSHKDPFQLPAQANLKSRAAETRKELLEGVHSDHLLYLQIFRKWQEEAAAGRVSDFCQDYFISHPSMNNILETRSQLVGQLRASGFVHQSNSIDGYSKHANSWPLVKAVLCTGVYPNISYPLNGFLATKSEKKVHVHTNSVLCNKQITTWLFYDEMIRHRNKLMIRGVTALTPLTASLMCGIDFITSPDNSVNIDNWLEFEFPDRYVVHLRHSVENLVKKVLVDPSSNFYDGDYFVVDTLRCVLESEEINASLRQPTNIGDKPLFFLPQARSKTAQGGPKSQQNGWKNRNGSNDQNRTVARSQEGFGNVSLPTKLLKSFNLTQDPAESLLNGLGQSFGNRGQSGRPHKVFNGSKIESKFGSYSDAKIFVLIKPRQRLNIEIAQQTGKWIFAPQTEKKIVHFSNNGKTIYLLFTAFQTDAFQGVAKYLSMDYGVAGKPAAYIRWVFTTDMQFSTVRHLRNPYNGAKRIFEGQDGQVVEQAVAEELLRIYQNVEDELKFNMGPVSEPGCSKMFDGH